MKTWFDRRRFLEAAAKLSFVCSVSYAGPGLRLPHAAGLDNEEFTVHQRRSLQRVCDLMFPYPELGDEPYKQAVSAIALIARHDPGIKAVINQGLDFLDNQQQRSWVELEEQQQISSLGEIEDGEFFQRVYQLTIDQLFTNKTVWEHIGYEGSSLEFGGYLHRGFDDINWL